MAARNSDDDRFKAADDMPRGSVDQHNSTHLYTEAEADGEGSVAGSVETVIYLPKHRCVFRHSAPLLTASYNHDGPGLLVEPQASRQCML